MKFQQFGPTLPMRSYPIEDAPASAELEPYRKAQLSADTCETIAEHGSRTTEK